MRTLVLVAVLLALLTATSAPLARETGSTVAAARADYLWIPSYGRPSGGVLLSADLVRTWAFDRVRLSLGAELGGTVDVPYWAAVLGGPTASVGYAVHDEVAVNLTLHADFGRVPTVSSWGYPMNYIGMFPALGGSLVYSPAPRVRLSLRAQARVVDTWSTGLVVAGGGGLGGEFVFF